jgi:hypothetical protein
MTAEEEKLYVKCTLSGEPARIVRELKERGMVASVREAVVHGILTYYEKVVQRDLERAQLKASQRLSRGE